MTLLCGLGLLAAFVAAPWTGRSLSDNGARLLADALFDASGQGPAAWLMLGLVPLVALAALVLGLWALADPDRAPPAGRIAALLGLGLLAGLAMHIVLQREAGLPPGTGCWLAVALGGGLVLHLVPPHALDRPQARLAPRLARWRVPSRWLPYLFLAPGLSLYLIWIIGPALYTIYLSFTDWNGVSPARWVGLDNFAHLLLRDSLFREALANNLRWLAVFVTVPAALGLLLALAFYASGRGLRPARASFYAPLAFSFPVIGLVWAWIYNPRLGLINSLLAALGVPVAPGWLADPHLAIWCVIAAAAWRQVGYVLVLYLAGLETVDPSLLDAARVDGAGPWQALRFVLLPLLGPITTLVLAIAVIDSLRAFDIVQVMTRGGQGTQVLATLMLQEAFTNYRMGYGAAIAVVLFALSSLCVGVYLARVMRAGADGR